MMSWGLILMYSFLIDKEYTKKDIYEIVNIPHGSQGGNWDTGYNKYLDDFFIFSNIDTQGRTGHRHNNRFEGELFYWAAKSNTTLAQPQIQQMINPTGFVYLFYRFDNLNPWIFAGTGVPFSYQDTSPVQIVWKIFGGNTDEMLSKPELDSMPPVLNEGTKRAYVVNVYERNPEARRLCINYWGHNCVVCGFDFEKIYGDYGKDFIHVHHLKPLSEIQENYCIDPEKDLRPVCPNCHSMIHRKTPAITVDELKLMLRQF